MGGPSTAFTFDTPMAATFRELAATAFGGRGSRLRAAAREAGTVNCQHAGARAEIAEATGRLRQLTANKRAFAARRCGRVNRTRGSPF